MVSLSFVMKFFARLSWEYSHAWTRGSLNTHRTSRFCPTIAQLSVVVLSSTIELFSLPLMSHTYFAASSSSQASTNFQLIINNALKAYEKRTKQDLLAHPLAAQLQTCDSPATILAVLQRQAQGLDRSKSSDDRWTKWLDPTISVLFSFSATVGAGVGLVCLRLFANLTSEALYLSGRC